MNHYRNLEGVASGLVLIVSQTSSFRKFQPSIFITLRCAPTFSRISGYLETLPVASQRQESDGRVPAVRLVEGKFGLRHGAQALNEYLPSGNPYTF